MAGVKIKKNEGGEMTQMAQEKWDINESMKEIWKDIQEFVGYYQISNMGNCRSLTRTIITKNDVKRTVAGQMMARNFNIHTGNYNFNLSKDGEVKTFPIWRLVLGAFTDYEFCWDDHREIVFLNYKRKDCRLSNLKLLEDDEASFHAMWQMLWDQAECYEQKSLVRMYLGDGTWVYPCGRVYDEKEKRGPEMCECKLCSSIRAFVNEKLEKQDNKEISKLIKQIVKASKTSHPHMDTNDLEVLEEFLSYLVEYETEIESHTNILRDIQNISMHGGMAEIHWDQYPDMEKEKIVEIACVSSIVFGDESCVSHVYPF